MATPALTLQHVSEFAADVRDSLTKSGQRELPSKYLYDEVGSALFEAICVLPEYGLTRADTRLLQENAAEIVSRVPSPVRVAELGSGSGKKTRWILEALSRRQITYYYPIEISPHALAACEIRFALGCEREPAGGAVEQAHAEAVFQARHQLGYRRGCQAHLARRHREAAQLHRLHECRHVAGNAHVLLVPRVQE